jgi:hypothetical protein
MWPSRAERSLREALDVYRTRAETAEYRLGQVEAENALLRRALALLVRSLEDRDPAVTERT